MATIIIFATLSTHESETIHMDLTAFDVPTKLLNCMDMDRFSDQ